MAEQLRIDGVEEWAREQFVAQEIVRLGVLREVISQRIELTKESIPRGFRAVLFQGKEREWHKSKIIRLQRALGTVNFVETGLTATEELGGRVTPSTPEFYNRLLEFELSPDLLQEADKEFERRSYNAEEGE